MHAPCIQKLTKKLNSAAVYHCMYVLLLMPINTSQISSQSVTHNHFFIDLTCSAITVLSSGPTNVTVYRLQIEFLQNAPTNPMRYAWWGSFPKIHQNHTIRCSQTTSGI